MITRAQIRPLLKTALDAATLFSAAGVTTILDSGSKAKGAEIADSLAGPGACLVIPPLLGSDNLDETAARLAERVAVQVEIQINPDANENEETGAGLSIEAAEDAVIAALLKVGAPEAALEGLRFDQGTVTALLENGGTVTKAVYFSVPVDTAAAA
jgi:hypothetical protein